MPSNSTDYMNKYMKSYLNDPEKGGKVCICDVCGHKYKQYDKRRHLKTNKHLGVERQTKKTEIELLKEQVAELKAMMSK